MADRKIQINDTDGASDTVEVTGYAHVFGPEQVYGGPAEGGFTEVIARDAFTAALAENPKVDLTVNFEGPSLARTADGTLSLEVDDVGLKIRATIPREVARKIGYRVDDRGQVPMEENRPELGYKFRVQQKDQQWTPAEGYETDEYAQRRIDALSLRGVSISTVELKPGDVSVEDEG